jgi:hypothetical protein
MSCRENINTSKGKTRIETPMVTQHEYNTNLQIVYEAMGLNYDEICEFLRQHPNAEVWGPAKEYALQKPTGRPFISRVIHFKHRDVKDIYRERIEWYGFLSHQGYVRMRLDELEVVERFRHYGILLQKDPERDRDFPEKILHIDFYYSSSAGNEIQIVYTQRRTEREE